jgi:hypothetical protein
MLAIMGGHAYPVYSAGFVDAGSLSLLLSVPTTGDSERGSPCSLLASPARFVGNEASSRWLWRCSPETPRCAA